MSNTPQTDAACGWPWGHHGRIECGDLKWSPDGPFVHSSVAREIERENAALREQLEQAAIDEGKLRRENTRLLEAILNAPNSVCKELDRRSAARKEEQP